MFKTVKIRIYTSHPHEKPADQQHWFLKLFISSRITEGTQPEVDSLPLLGSLQEDLERTDNSMQTSRPWRELVTPQLPLNVSLPGSERLEQSRNINEERWQKIFSVYSGSRKIDWDCKMLHLPACINSQAALSIGLSV